MLIIYRPDPRRIFEMLLGQQIRFAQSGPCAIDEADFVWEIGTAYLGGKNTSIWLARRLGVQKAAERLEQTHAARPPGDVRVVLTSTGRPPPLQMARAALVPIGDVLSTLDQTKIDVPVLEARIAGRPEEPVTSPVFLSADDRTLFIRGDAVVTLGGKKQRRLLRLMVDAHDAGKPFSAMELLEKAGSSATSFDQAFGKNWSLLRKYLRSRDGVWRFEV